MSGADRARAGYHGPHMIFAVSARRHGRRGLQFGVYRKGRRRGWLLPYCAAPLDVI